jgi:hypothetical protein
MTLLLAIGIPVFLVFGGALLAFSFGAGDESEEVRSEAVKEVEQPAARPLVFFQPVGWSRDLKAASVEEIVADIEQHLHRERQAAKAFAQDPSPETLWLD